MKNALTAVRPARARSVSLCASGPMAASMLGLLCAAGVMGATAGRAMGQGFVPPANSNIRSVLEFGAVPNDGQDDLGAFQAALNALVGTSRVLYVPDGVYNFSGRLNWGGVGVAGLGGGFFVMQGQSQAGVILKLNDGAAGFGDPNNPRVFIDAYEGNTANQFRNYLRDVTIDAGANNPGVFALEFQANNTGRIENVTIRSSDPQKRGRIGLMQGFEFPGPMLVRNVTIDGFDEGYVGAPQEYNVVFENLTLRNQRVRGIYVWRLPLQIRNLVSENSVPVLESFANPGAWGHVVIDGAMLTGLAGASTRDAIVNHDGAGVITLRNVTTTGYRFAVNDEETLPAAVTLPSGVVSQYSSDVIASAFPSPTGILNVPIEETPAVPSVPVSEWVSVKSFGAIENDNLDDTAAVQAALKSGAAVVYFPSGLYSISDTLELGPSVQRIEGFLSNLSLNAPLATENRPVFRVPAGSQAVVHINGVQASFQSVVATNGGGVWLEQATPNTVVVRDGDLTGYRNTVPGGRVFLENVVGSAMVFTGQKVWARQLNPEGSQFTHVTNVGGEMYVLGLKTEGTSTVLENRGGARTTIMGGLIYPSSAILDRGRPMIVNEESSLSFSLPESGYVDPNNVYAIWVRETRGGVTTNFTRGMVPFGRGHSVLGGQLALYNGYVADSTGPSVPGAPTVVTRGSGSVQIAWGASADAQTGVARYNVYRNGQFLRAVMATAAPVLVDDAVSDGTAYSYRVSAVNGAGVESAQSAALVTGTLADGTPPEVAGVTVGLDPRGVVVRFTKPMATVAGSSPGSYRLVGPGGATVAVTGASLSADGMEATLTTAAMSPGVHELSFVGLSDRATAPNGLAQGLRTTFAYSGVSNGSGLTGRYYLNSDFIGSPVLTRVDSTVNFEWSASGPGGGVPQANYAVRWTGQLRPRFNEVYTISTISDDGTRVYIDGRLVVENWFSQAPTERSGTIALDSSRSHDIVVEYYQGNGGASVQLLWQSASQGRQVIPASQLFPTPRLRVVRTLDGAGADTSLNRVNPTDNGAGNSMGVFHSPAAGAFHDAAYWRFDLTSLDLANNHVVSAVATLSQTFFGIGDGKRQINVFGVNQAPGADNWAETGPGFVTWATAAGNDDSGALCNPLTARWMSTFVLDNTGFNLNNQPDKTLAASGPRLAELIRADTDGRVTLMAKRVDASNEGQSWFTKEWGLPIFAPALKVQTVPACPVVSGASPALEAQAGQSVAVLARVSGRPPIVTRWLRDGIEVSGSSRTIASGAAGNSDGTFDVWLTISEADVGQSGAYALRASNACGEVTGTGTSVTITPAPCAAEYNGDGVLNTDDLSDFITDYFTQPAVAGPGGFAVACAGAPTPYDTDGYKSDFNQDCSVNTDDISDYITAYFQGC